MNGFMECRDIIPVMPSLDGSSDDDSKDDGSSDDVQ